MRFTSIRSTFAYNTAVQSKPKFSPFRLLYSVDSVSAIDIIFSCIPIPEDMPLSEVTCRSEECRQIVRCRTVDRSSDEAALRKASPSCRVPGRQTGSALGSCSQARPLWKAQLPLVPTVFCAGCPPVTYMVELVDPLKDHRHRSTESARVPQLNPYITSGAI